ncbi:MAG: hypothetical protein KC582_00770 [Candidatus Magasanikbacteria bacterium]|nr:hypothetical protein [Candidatus Magasanikbacteria bacterium]
MSNVLSRNSQVNELRPSEARLSVIILDYTKDMEPFAEEAYNTLLTALLDNRHNNQKVALSIYQGDYLELYHEDHLRLKMIDSMPVFGKYGGASRAITQVLESVFRRYTIEREPLIADVLYIGSGNNTDEDQDWIRRRDRAIRQALRWGWTFDVIHFGDEEQDLCEQIGFSATHDSQVSPSKTKTSLVA